MMKGLTTHAKLFNASAPGANTNILSSNISVKEDCALKISVALTTSSVFNIVVTDGSDTHVIGLNESNALNAADGYTFTFGAVTKDSNGTALSYNFQIETDGVVEYLVVQEAQNGTTG